MEDKIIKTDLLGEVIEPGCLIALSRTGKNTKAMEINIVSIVDIREDGKGIIYLFDKPWAAPKANLRSTWTIASKEEMQEHIIIIKNPYFSLGNKKIARQMVVADSAIEQGFLPKNYYLGTPLSLLKEE